MEFSELYKVLMEIVKKEVPEKCKNLLDDKILKKVTLVLKDAITEEQFTINLETFTDEYVVKNIIFEKEKKNYISF